MNRGARVKPILRILPKIFFTFLFFVSFCPLALVSFHAFDGGTGEGSEEEFPPNFVIHKIFFFFRSDAPKNLHSFSKAMRKVFSGNVVKESFVPDFPRQVCINGC